MAHQSPPTVEAGSCVESRSSKRKLLKLLSGSAVSAGVSVPVRWSAPLVATVVLPVHAQSSINPTPDPCGDVGSDQPGSKGSGGPTASDPEACCDSVRPANPSYPTDATYLDEGCCAQTGKTDSTICCDDNVADKTDVRYAEQCCDKPGRDLNGDLAKNANGEYICCDGLDQNSQEYINFCCDNISREPNGQPVTDTSGNPVCCEGASKDPNFCCIKKEVTHAASIDKTKTDWTTKSGNGTTAQFNTVELPKWDPADGPLAEVRLTVTGDIESSGWFESADNSPVVATFTAEATLLTEGPNGVLLSAQPTANVNKLLEPGDGVSNSGPDYWVVPAVTASRTETQSITDPLELAQFYIGSGERVDIEMTATGRSDFSGSGNGASFIETYASATISVTYYCKASDI